MTGKGRVGPRERQTMSGILARREQRDDGAPSEASSDPNAFTRPTPPALSVIVDGEHLTLWQRMVSAAERAFEKDDTPAPRSPTGGGRTGNGR